MNCNQTLANLLKTCQDKQVVGGVKTKVYITLRDNIDFDACTLDTDNNVITKIALKSDKKWYLYEFDKNTASLASEYSYDGTSGEKAFCTNNLTLVFRRMDASKRLAITSLLNSEIVVVVTDNNGTTYFLGWEEYVASTSASFNSGTAKTDSNGTTIVLTDTSAELPLQVAEACVKDDVIANVSE